MGGVRENKVRLSVRRTPVTDSRSTPNRYSDFGLDSEPVPDSPLGVTEFFRMSQGLVLWLLHPTGLEIISAVQPARLKANG